MSYAWWSPSWWADTGHDWSIQGSSAGPSQADWPPQRDRSATSSSSREADTWQAAGQFPSNWAPAPVTAGGAAALPREVPPQQARLAASPQPMPPANEPPPAPPPPASAEAGPLAKSSAVAPPGLVPPAGHALAPALPQPPAGLESTPGQDLNRTAALQLVSPAPQQQQPAEDLTQAPQQQQPASSSSSQPQGWSPISTGNDAANAAKPRMKAPPPLPARAAALAPPPGIQQGPAQSESPPAEPKQRGASDGKQPVPASALAGVDAAAAAVQPTQFPTLEATPPLPPPPEARPPADASSTEDVSASAEAGDTLGQDLIDNYSRHRVLGTPHPPLAPPPEAARTEQPVQQQPIRVWTREVAIRTAAGQAPVSRRMAHEFLAAWRAEGRYPDKHIEDLTDSGAFNWVAYLAGHPYAAYVFGRGGICKFEIRYLRPHDTNTRDFRCDFVAYRLDGDAIRLHPGNSAEAIPVWSPDIRALAMDWSLADPLPGYGARTREEDWNTSVFRHISDNDRMNGKMFQAWLAAEKLNRPELRNITEPAADGSWFPWPLLLASVSRLQFMSLAGVTKVATCKLADGTIGLFFRTRVNEEVVIVQMANNSLTVQKGDMALRHVVDVAAP